MTAQRSIDNAEALYRKLERTFYRRPHYKEHQIDWVFDFAVSAWHLVEWVARERQSQNKSVVQTTQALLKKKCPEIAVCEQVCSGAKHFVLDNPQLKPFNIASDVKGTADLMGISGNVYPGENPVDVILTPSVSITDKDGRNWQATMLFHSVLSFWQNELGLQPSVGNWET